MDLLGSKKNVNWFETCTKRYVHIIKYEVIILAFLTAMPNLCDRVDQARIMEHPVDV